MRIKFNPSITQVNKGLLYTGFNIYPDETSKTYPLQRVLKPDGRWEVNPMLCHLITLPESFTLDEAKSWLTNLYTKDRLATLDSILALTDSTRRISPYMRNKGKFGTAVLTRDYADLIASVNLKLSKLPALDISGGTAELVEPGTIDIGAGATDRASTSVAAGYTVVDLNNPANATGTVDTFEFWFRIDSTGVSGGIFFLVSGTTYEARSSFLAGNVAGGSKQTFTGQTLSTTLADFIGAYWSGGDRLEADTSGGLNYLYKLGEFIDAGDQAVYDAVTGAILSLYGTGVEAGGGIVRQMMEYHGG